MIPAWLLTHTATISPITTAGGFGEDFDMPCLAEMDEDADHNLEGLQNTGHLYAELGTAVPVGSRLSVRGQAGTVVKVERFDDGGVTGLAHRRIDWTYLPMTGTCTIEESTGSTFDPNTNQQVQTWEAVYTGTCRVEAQSVETIDSVVGGQLINQDRYQCAIPWTAAETRPGMRLTVQTAVDPRQVGLQVFIESGQVGTVGAEHRFTGKVDRG